jgi:hypothetical protein
MKLATIQPTAGHALPAFDSPEWRRDFARGMRAAFSAAGTRPAYLVRALAAMRSTLGPSDLFEVAAPHQSSNGKLAKNAVATLAFTGAPDASSGRYDTCPASTAGCRALCVLSDACGYAAIERRAGGVGTIMAARARRVIALREHPVAAGAELARCIARAARMADRYDVRAVARLNVGTDLPWEQMPEIGAAFARFKVEGYAYTKRPHAVRLAMRTGGWANATRIVYSWSEDASPRLAVDYLRAGGTVAVVFAGLGIGAYADPMPRAFVIDGTAWTCIDGDATDDRTTDPPGCVVALRGKGPLATRDASRLAQANRHGFAVMPSDPRIRR